MKIAGKVLSGPRIETIVLPRQGGDVVIRAQAVLNFDDFEKQCPQPEPEKRMYPGGKEVLLVDSKKYKDALSAYAEKQTNWMMIKSLAATKDLEWDTVNLNDPDTWGNYMTEMKESFTFAEVAMIMGAVTDACGMNRAKVDEATERFLAAQAEMPEE